MPRGRARFLELISAKPDYDTEARDLFRVKISNFVRIDPAHQQLILTDYRAHVAAIVAKLGRQGSGGPKGLCPGASGGVESC